MIGGIVYLRTLYLGCGLTAVYGTHINIMTVLLENLIKDYNSLVRPVPDQRTVTQVEVTFHLAAIQELNTKEQTLSTAGYIRAIWKDEFLTWNPDDYENTTKLLLPLESVWRPVFLIRNSAKMDTDWSSTSSLVMVEWDGTITWSHMLMLTTWCGVDVLQFPVDQQLCSLDLCSWLYNDSSVFLEFPRKALFLDDTSSMGEWGIKDGHTSHYTAAQGFTGIRFMLTLERREFFYIFDFFIPVIILSGMNVLVFLLPADCGERMNLSITVLLAFTVYLSVISEYIPSASSQLPILAVYLSSLLLLSAASVFCAGTVLNIHYRDRDTPIPSCLHAVCSKYCYPYLTDIDYSTQGFMVLSSMPAGVGRGTALSWLAQQPPPKVQEGSGSGVTPAEQKPKEAPQVAPRISPLTMEEENGTIAKTDGNLAIDSSANATQEDPHSDFTGGIHGAFRHHVTRRPYVQYMTWHEIGDSLDRLFFWALSTLTLMVNVVCLLLLHAPHQKFDEPDHLPHDGHE